MGLDNTESIKDGYNDNAGAMLVEVEDMQAIENGQTLSFKLPNALQQKDNLVDARTIVIVEDKNAFLKDPSACPSITVKDPDIDLESFNFLTGTATINVDNMEPPSTKEIEAKGCVIAERAPVI